MDQTNTLLGNHTVSGLISRVALYADKPNSSSLRFIDFAGEMTCCAFNFAHF